MKKALVVVAAVNATALASAQPVGQVTLTEGTSMALALAPDGGSIAIELQGRIWTLPLGGGAARALTDELGDARQPSFPPDGNCIAFHAYRDGNWHIWSVGVDGSGLTQHARGPFDDREPHWSHERRPPSNTSAPSEHGGRG